MFAFIGLAVMQLIMVVVQIALIIAVTFITRAVFSISTMVKNLRAQTKLLYEIAKIQGVDETVIEVIKNDAK
jgi:hypothetical protein